MIQTLRKGPHIWAHKICDISCIQ